MSLTVRDLFDQVRQLAGSAGVCDETDFMSRLNIAGQMLMKRIDADGMMWEWRLCPCGNCVVLPSSIHAVRQAWLGLETMDLRSEWWHGRLTGGLRKDHFTDIPWQNFVDSGRRIATQRVVSAGINEVFEVKSFSKEDAGVEVVLHYSPEGAGDTKVWKATLNENLKPVRGKTRAGEVLRFEKPRTKGPVELWTYDLSTGHRRLLAVYGRYEEVPQYPVYEISGTLTGSLIIKGKRTWTPPRDLDDVVWFGDAEVWGSALIAQAAWSNGNNAEKEQNLGFAIAALALDLKDKRPASQAQGVQFISPWSIKNKCHVR
jgi:hypothetical protein